MQIHLGDFWHSQPQKALPMALLKKLAPRCSSFVGRAPREPSFLGDKSYEFQRLDDLPKFAALKSFTPQVSSIDELFKLLKALQLGETIRRLSGIDLHQFFHVNTIDSYRPRERDFYFARAKLCIPFLAHCSRVTVRRIEVILLSRPLCSSKLFPRSESPD